MANTEVSHPDQGSAHRPPPTAHRLHGVEQLENGQAYLGIELGSTRIKACAITGDGTVLAMGSHSWENQFIDGHWTYPEQEIWVGLQAAIRELLGNIEQSFSSTVTRFAGIGVSAMMHGYLAFDATGTMLTPFRTWRDTYTAPASEELREALGVNIPARWSIAHLFQAVCEREPHLKSLNFLTTLAGYVHWKLTGNKVLGIDDASGMFPIDSATQDYDEALLIQTQGLLRERGCAADLRSLLPTVLVAGQDAGTLSENGARLLDPTGTLEPGVPLCPPEGDAGTGMVATNAVAPRSGNVSAGTSIFAMTVLERPLEHADPAIDLVTTPDGAPVAMIHCNNGGDELEKWVHFFQQTLALFGEHKNNDDVWATLLAAASADPYTAGDETGEALSACPAGDVMVAFNFRSGEPLVGISDGLPLLLRPKSSELSPGAFIRTQIYSMFASLAVGLRSLARQHVVLDVLCAHGGLFKTASVIQQFLASVTNTPVKVQEDAGEGGAWGIALLAAYAGHVRDVAASDAKLPDSQLSLGEFLDRHIFAQSCGEVLNPDPRQRDGFARFLTSFEKYLPLEQSIHRYSKTTSRGDAA